MDKEAVEHILKTLAQAGMSLFLAAFVAGVGGVYAQTNGVAPWVYNSLYWTGVAFGVAGFIVLVVGVAFGSSKPESMGGWKRDDGTHRKS